MCFNTGTGCESTLTRFVWAGDQLLWELRVPGGNNVVAGSSGLDATNASGDMYGRVSYFHAGGIDKPLLITREGVESVVPRDTWRGQFHAGTSPRTGASRNCPVGVHTGCLLIAWPGWKTTASHAWGGEEAPDIDVWYGGLVDGMRDASGQMYMRNRYYDPATGQFTQTDPIGLAGGLNAYGFAAGDPVSYSDPYGLCADHDPPQDSTRALTLEERERLTCIARTRFAEGTRTAFLRDLNAGLVRVQVSASTGDWAYVPFGASPPIVFAEGTILRQPEVHVALTAAHEVRHKGQRTFREVRRALEGGYYDVLRESMEADAEAYAF
ncbi:RHS repeat-associated core domain-containing protein [Longimicrobium sp.]|uniref:RHS repeat-associated core domain-containing protein n=1 Tax=Longimicrobium sp. TaxID=2029185 RepID=UPI002E37AA8B|nr:RHS repeat-associated core domain-containing protein [Longimicrobium sp.]HEX6042346.1 RHS repeat-associated core domain-containing protein [Longimicrobium sp.]